MSQLILTRGNGYRRGLFKKLFQLFELGPYSLIVSLILFVVLVTIITLMFSTNQVTKGYALNRLEAEHQDLVKEGERNEMEISQVRSLNYIQNSSKVRSMRRPGQVVFVSGGDTAIASR